MSQSLPSFAMLFPGQGSQVVGMARDLADNFASARAAMAEADDTLGIRLSTLCYDGPEEVLTDTINAQPALMAASVAALRAIAEVIPDLPAPSVVAGHSMGEYSALVAAGSLSYADGLRLVRERGRLMKQAGERNPGGMAAVLGLEIDVVDAICAEARASTGAVVQVANDNCPGQVVVSGDDLALEDAMQRLSAAGARKVVRLAVSIAAHSPLMAPAADELRQAIEATEIRPPAVPVVGNVRGLPLQTVEDVRADLVAQLTASVRWTESMRFLVSQGISTVVEVGSGDVLSNLMKRIERDVRRLAVGDSQGIDRLRAWITE